MSESVSRPKHDSMRRHDLGYFRLAATVPVQESAGAYACSDRASACSKPGGWWLNRCALTEVFAVMDLTSLIQMASDREADIHDTVSD